MQSRQRKQYRDPRRETSWTRKTMARLSETLARGRQAQIVKDLGGQGQKLEFRLCNGRALESFKVCWGLIFSQRQSWGAVDCSWSHPLAFLDIDTVCLDVKSNAFISENGVHDQGT